MPNRNTTSEKGGCRGLGAVRCRLVGGGSEGTPGNPSSARATRVPEVLHPVVRSGSCGRLTGHPLRPPRMGDCRAVPITVTTMRGTSWQGPGRAARSLGAARVWAVTDGVTGRQPATPDGWRGCTGARPQDWSEHRGTQLHVAASPAPRTGPGASPPTPAATTQPAKPQPPPNRTAPEASDGSAAPRRGAGNCATSHNTPADADKQHAPENPQGTPHHRRAPRRKKRASARHRCQLVAPWKPF